MRGKASLTETLPGPGEVAVADGAICAQVVRCGKPNCKCAGGSCTAPTTTASRGTSTAGCTSSTCARRSRRGGRAVRAAAGVASGAGAGRSAGARSGEAGELGAGRAGALDAVVDAG
jgi:hypothetical protein